MGNLFDILLIAVTAGTVIVCYKLGVFKMLKPFRKLVAFLLAWSLKDTPLVNKTVGKAIRSDGIKNFINERVKALWGERLYEAAEADGVAITERFDEVFGFVGKVFSNLKDFCALLYEKEIVNSVPGESISFSEKVESFVYDTVGYITDSAIGFFTTFIGFLILYVIFSVGFWLAAKVLDGIFSEGLLGFLNRALGGVAGICYGFIFSWLLSLFLVLVLPLITKVPQSEVLGGILGVTEWYCTDFFVSRLLGITV